MQDIGTLDGFVRKEHDSHTETSNTIWYELSILSVTRTEFRDVYNEICERMPYLVNRIGETLDADDREGFLAITANPERFQDDNDALDTFYVKRFDNWQEKSTNVHSASREIEISSVEVIRPDTVRVTFDVYLTLLNGNRYIAEDCQFVLQYVSDDWYLTNLSNELLSISANDWTVIE